MLFAELKDDLVIFRKKHGFSWHESADDYISLSFPIPFEIMKRSLKGLNLRYLIIRGVIEIQTKLSIVWFTCGIIVGLKFDKEAIGGWAELDLDFFCFIDVFGVDRLIFYAIEELELSFTALAVQEVGSDQIVFRGADGWNIDEMLMTWGDRSDHLRIRRVHLYRLRVVSEHQWVITRESDQWVASLDVIVWLSSFSIDGNGLEGLQAVDGGFSFVYIHLV